MGHARGNLSMDRLRSHVEGMRSIPPCSGVLCISVKYEDVCMIQ